MKTLSRVLSLFLLVGCGKVPDKPDPKDPVQDIEARYSEVEARLKSEFVENGWIVSRSGDKSPQHQGEGLLWDGIYLSVARCDDLEIEDMLIRTVISNDGALIRYFPLGEYENGREVTLDGALGFYRGVGSRVARCPDAADRWDLALTLHRQYLATHDQSLNANANSKLILGFEKIPEVVAGYKDESITGLLQTIVTWATTVNATHAAAYRVHLGFLAIQTLETAGYAIPDLYRNGFCAATRGVDIPTIDHWCARGDLLQFINDFQFDVWEYRFQRSGSWEFPDAAPYRTPGLDYLVAVRQYFK